jgi:hypothetical protein
MCTMFCCFPCTVHILHGGEYWTPGLPDSVWWVKSGAHNNYRPRVCIPYSGKFSWGPIFADGQSLTLLRFNFRGCVRSCPLYTEQLYLFRGSNFCGWLFIRENFPLYGCTCKHVHMYMYTYTCTCRSNWYQHLLWSSPPFELDGIRSQRSRDCLQPISNCGCSQVHTSMTKAWRPLPNPISR